MHANSADCPLCHSQPLGQSGAFASDTTRPTRITVRNCPACGLAWQHPLARSTGDSVDFFQSAYQDQTTDSYFDPLRRKAIAALQAEVAAQWLTPGASVLDVGAGDGAFVRAAAARGLAATGVDPAAPENADLPPGAQLRRGDLASLDPALRFDAVTAFDVIEHVEDPEALVAACVARLRPDGLLLLETGNYQSADRIAGADHWWCYQADHRWYFAPGNLARLLRAQGLAEVGLWPKMLRPGAPDACAYAGPSRSRLIGELVRRPWESPTALRRHAALREAARAWPRWSGLPIFLLVARRAGGLPAGLIAL